MDPYKILNTTKDSTDAEIKKSYRKLAAKHHPDRGGNEERFKQINEAYSLISTAVKRKNFANRARQKPTAGSFHRNFNFEDIFEGFFGGNRAAPQKKTSPQEDKDIVFDIRVSLEQVKRGATESVSFMRRSSCRRCSGIGGKKKSSCPHCAGRGYRVVRTSSIIQQVTCRACLGSGQFIQEKCETCAGSGIIKTRETVNINIKETTN